MATSTAPNKFRDFDRFLIRGNFFVTIIGSALAFAFSFYDQSYLSIDEYMPPYGLSLSFAMIIVVAVYAKNIASSLIVGISAGLGLMSPSGNDLLFVQAYIAICIILALTLGFLADRLRLVLNWVRYYLISTLIASSVIIGFSFIANEGSTDYEAINDPSIDIAGSNDFGTGTDWPLYEIIALVFIFLVVLIVAVVTKGQIILDKNSSKKYVRVGNFFVLVAHTASLATLYFLTINLSQGDMEDVTGNPNYLRPIADMFSHRSSGGYAIIEDPFNIFVIIAVIITLTHVGLALRTIGQHQGNIEGMKGKSDVAYLAVPWGIVMFLVGSSFLLAENVYGGGFYVSQEVLVPFTLLAWAMIYLNLLVARIILWILDKLSN
ncbi:MAG: hypothetical protein IH840_04050 [Candidatus Heimdallarchaeota archaeon]|nr:hypothetical protein [Candidatus Heimdallarchaeota archaeon]